MRVIPNNMTVRLSITLIAAGLFATTLVGCTSPDDPVETPTPATPATAGPSSDQPTPPVFSGDVGPRANTHEDPANGIYVSPDGNDATANGTIDSPYASINAALGAAQAGDTVVLRAGTYREGTSVRVRLPNITIKSRQGEWAIIDLTTFDSGADDESGVYFDVDSSGGTLQSVEVIGGFYAVALETKWDWGDPADRGGASNITIEDCVLHDSRYDVVKVKPNSNDVTIRHNEIFNSGTAFKLCDPDENTNAEGIDNVNGANMHVHNNHIHHICTNGVYAKGGATDAIIEYNRITDVNGAGILVGFDTSPEYFDTDVNPKYYENINGVVRNNLIVGAVLAGIGLYASKDAQVYNNTLVNVATGAYHSALYFGITYQDWEDYAGRPANVNPNIHHNVISQSSAVKRPMIEIRYADELGGLSALEGYPTMNNNCYYKAGGSATFVDTRPGSARPGRVLENANLAAWQSHISGDKDSLEVDPALDDDQIATNPQCAGVGITMPLTTNTVR